LAEYHALNALNLSTSFTRSAGLNFRAWLCPLTLASTAFFQTVDIEFLLDPKSRVHE